MRPVMLLAIGGSVVLVSLLFYSEFKHNLLRNTIFPKQDNAVKKTNHRSSQHVTPKDIVKKVSHSISQHVKPQTTSEALVTCRWPAPLYKTSRWTALTGNVLSSTLTNIERVYNWLDNDAFAYIEAGTALGLYRDRRLVSDGDLDVMFGTTRNKLRYNFPSFISGYHVSMNDISRWGDPHSGYGFSHVPTKEDVVRMRAKLCVLRYDSVSIPLVLNEPWQRMTLESMYGPLWFVRMPWKGDHDMLVGALWAPLWRQCVDVLKRMDSNSDGHINEAELKVHVQHDGMDMTQYEQRLTQRDRCRAVARANWLLNNGLKHKSFALPKAYVGGDPIPFWLFPEC